MASFRVPRLFLLLFLAAVAQAGAAPVSPSPTPEAAAPPAWTGGTKVLVVGGGTSHDFKKWFDEADVATLRADGSRSVNYTESPEVASRALGDADVLVMSTNQAGFDTPDFRAALEKFVAAGKGVVLLHPAVWYNWPWAEYNRTLVGGGTRGHDEVGAFEVRLVRDHPVTHGLPGTFPVTDELYHMTFDPAGTPTEVLAETSPSPQTGRKFPSIWVVDHPRARIVAIALGHDGRVHELPEYQKLLTNAVTWVASGPAKK